MPSLLQGEKSNGPSKSLGSQPITFPCQWFNDSVRECRAGRQIRALREAARRAHPDRNETQGGVASGGEDGNGGVSPRPVSGEKPCPPASSAPAPFSPSRPTAAIGTSSTTPRCCSAAASSPKSAPPPI